VFVEARSTIKIKNQSSICCAIINGKRPFNENNALSNKLTGVRHKVRKTTKQFRARSLSSLLLAMKNDITANKNIFQMKTTTHFLSLT
jgi:hypothetical protein